MPRSLFTSRCPRLRSSFPYKDARQLQQLILNRAREASLNGAGPRRDWFTIWVFHRFLARVFSTGSESIWAVKGGTAALVYSQAARSTRDVDLQVTSVDIESARQELLRLVDKDLGDFLKFRPKTHSDILLTSDQPTVVGTRVTFSVSFGPKLLQDLNVDVTGVSQQLLHFTQLESASELSVPGLEAPMYRVITVESQVAEKIAIMVQNPGLRGSTRGRDLFDVIFYLNSFSITRRRFQESFELCLKLRDLQTPTEFKVPQSMIGTFDKLAGQGDLNVELQNFDNAEKLVQSFLGFSDTISLNATWSPQTLKWEN